MAMERSQDEATDRNQAAAKYLSSLLGKTLRIKISDGRVFVGQMKCTDKDRNIILANTHEYRPPTTEAVRAAAVKADRASDKFTANGTCRYVGLVVIPGEHILKIELEEYDSSAIS